MQGRLAGVASGVELAGGVEGAEGVEAMAWSFSDKARLVALQVADEMPLDVLGELVGLVAPFLDVVFAEDAHSCIVSFLKFFDGLPFGDGDQLDGIEGPLGACGCGFDFGVNGFEIVSDGLGHGDGHWRFGF